MPERMAESEMFIFSEMFMCEPCNIATKEMILDRIDYKSPISFPLVCAKHKNHFVFCKLVIFSARI